MSWLFLALTIAGDLAGTTALERASRGHYRRYLALAAVGYLLAIYTFARALQTIPTGVADAVYFAGTTALVAVYSVTWLGERLSIRKATALLLIVVGVVALRLEAAHG